MADLIDRQAAIDAIGEIHSLDYNAQAIKARIEQLPSAQSERKAGKWVEVADDYKLICSACGSRENVPTVMGKPNVWNYCPNCGARMESE